MAKAKKLNLVEIRPNHKSNNNVKLQTQNVPAEQRLAVKKTYKLYIGGEFPRTESGRYYTINDKSGAVIANVCRASRKDLRDAVVIARAAQDGWAAKSSYNRGQILYRLAEILECRKAQFVEELMIQGMTHEEANTETLRSIDCVLYYAGWSDKYQQIFSSVNPVSSSHFNFSMTEPMGVVGIISPEKSPLFGVLSTICPVIVGGNTTVLLSSYSMPLSSITLGEAIATSDVPKGVINILTGMRSELLSQFASHMDVNALVYCGSNPDEIKGVKIDCSKNLKRVRIYDDALDNIENKNPYKILDCQEIKTTWHPIGN